MKLFPPQIEVKMYEQGFEGDDLLERREAGVRLSDLLEKVEDSIVVALNGPWGSGKSYFLKRWVGAHRTENSGTATTIYFDAFANDYLDDPLIALTGAIDDILPNPEKSKWKGAKRAAVKLLRPALRIGSAVATAGATELAGPLFDAAIGVGKEEFDKSVDQFWENEKGRKAAMKQFRTSLTELTSVNENTDAPKRLIIVIDELDRCRPDYALSTLEVIKHFFSVPRVHFVLGINMDALEHIVRVRYGAGINATDYLKRFISLSMRLPETTSSSFDNKSQIIYFLTSAGSMGFGAQMIGEVKNNLELVIKPCDVSLRDIEKILTHLVLLPKRKSFEQYPNGWRLIAISLLFFKILRYDLYRLAIDRQLKIEQVSDFYGITPQMISRENEHSGEYNHFAYIIHGLWMFLISNGTKPEGEVSLFSASFDRWTIRDVGGLIAKIDKEFLGLFEVVEPSTTTVS